MAYYALSPLAMEDLRDIWRYGAGRWGAEQTEVYGEKLLAAFGFLTENPKIGVSIDYVRQGYRKHPTGSHLIIYRITSECIEVIRILHKRADVERHLYN